MICEAKSKPCNETNAVNWIFKVNNKVSFTDDWLSCQSFSSLAFSGGTSVFHKLCFGTTMCFFFLSFVFQFCWYLQNCSDITERNLSEVWQYLQSIPWIRLRLLGREMTCWSLHSYFAVIYSMVLLICSRPCIRNKKVLLLMDISHYYSKAIH